MTRFLTLALAMLAMPISADAQAGLSSYVRARAADAAGVDAVATAGYAAALDAAPNDEVLALRAYRHALSTGDRALAVRTAAILDRRGLLPADGRLLLLGEAVAAANWRLASAQIDRIEADGAFGFASPVLRAWVAMGAGGDPLAALDAATKAGAVGAIYVAEHRALLQAATGDAPAAVAGVRALQSVAGGPPVANGQALRLRVAVAAAIQRKHRRLALQLLDADDPVTKAAARLVKKRKALPAPVTTPAAGIAELLIRIAADINRERVTPLALGFARMATFLAPDNATGWLVTSELLAGDDRPEAALSALARIGPADPFAEAARLGRVQLLVRTGEAAKALAEVDRAKPKTRTAAEWSRIGSIQAEIGRYREAAASFDQALATAPENDGDRWTLQLMKGNALQQAGDWPAARAALEAAAKAAPDQALVLNHLGYSKLERREDLAEAEALIRRASTLRPDDPAITDSLGWAYFIRGDLKRAVPTLEKAAAGNPADPTINEHLGDAYWAAGRRYEARYAWTAARVYAEGADAERLTAKLDRGFEEALAAR